MKQLFKVYYQNFIGNLIGATIALGISILYTVLFGVADDFEDLRFLVLIGMIGIARVCKMIVKESGPYFKDYFDYVKQSKCERATGAVVSIKEEVIPGRWVIRNKYPVIQIVDSENQIVLDVCKAKWEMEKQYTFLYLKNTKIAIIADDNNC